MEEHSIGIFFILVFIAGLVANIFGRSKHIGFWWTFFLLIPFFITGVIALILSPSAIGPPTPPRKRYKIWGLILLVWGIVSFIVLASGGDSPGVSTGLSVIILGLYLIQLSKGKIVNKNPYFIFGGNNQEQNSSSLKSDVQPEPLDIFIGSNTDKSEVKTTNNKGADKYEIESSVKGTNYLQVGVGTREFTGNNPYKIMK